MAPCQLCDAVGRRAVIKRPKTGQAVCREVAWARLRGSAHVSDAAKCFFAAFELEIHRTITDARLFRRGERVAIAASGGKDSTVLAYVLTLLNRRHDYGLDLQLLSIDEGITGYRDASLDTVKRNAEQYDLALRVLSYDELFHWTMDRVVAQTGQRGNCTYCGVFRRRALDHGAALLDVDHLVTGHNADDVAETVLMNGAHMSTRSRAGLTRAVLRGDTARLERAMAIVTGPHDGEDGLAPDTRPIKRSKPLKYTYEKEVVMYAYFKRLDYHSTECIYSPTAYRGHARALIKDLEATRPLAILDIIYAGEAMAKAVHRSARRPEQRACERCGALASNAVCQACALLDGLAAGTPKPRPHANGCSGVRRALVSESVRLTASVVALGYALKRRCPRASISADASFRTESVSCRHGPRREAKTGSVVHARYHLESANQKVQFMHYDPVVNTHVLFTSTRQGVSGSGVRPKRRTVQRFSPPRGVKASQAHRRRPT